MPKPTDSPLFATDPTFALDGDDWGGDPTRDDPGAGRLAEGFEPDKLPAEWLNWVLGVHGDWLDWVDGAIGASGLTLDAIVEITKFLSPFDFVPSAGTAGSAGLDNGPSCLYVISINDGLVSMDLTPSLKRNAELKRVRVHVTPGAARATLANRMEVRVWRRTFSALSGTATITETQLGTTQYDDGNATAQWVTVSFAGVVPGDSSIYVTVTAGNTAGVNNDFIGAVQVTQDVLVIGAD